MECDRSQVRAWVLGQTTIIRAKTLKKRFNISGHVASKILEKMCYEGELVKIFQSNRVTMYKVKGAVYVDKFMDNRDR